MNTLNTNLKFKTPVLMHEGYYGAQIFSGLLIAIQLVVFCLWINGNFYGSDFENYWQGAQSILSGTVYSTHGSNLLPDSFRPFGYPLVIAIFVYGFGEYYQFFLVAFQALLCMVMLGLTFRLLKKIDLLNLKSIAIATVLYSHPTWLYTATQMQCDILIAFFAFLYIYFLIIYYESRKLCNIYIAVLMLSISLYFRPFYLYFIPLVILGIAIWIRPRVAVIAALIFLAVITPWIGRNKLVLDSYKFSMLGDVALAYIAGDTIRHAKSMEQNEAYSFILRESGVGENFEGNKQDQTMYKKLHSYSIKVIMENPGSLIQATVRGLVRVFGMPHEIYQLKNGTTIPIDRFIEILRSNPQQLIKEVNGFFIYLYVFPYLINAFILLSMGAFFLNVRRWSPGNHLILLCALPIFFYGWVIPGPINKSHYITMYYFGLVLIAIFTANNIGRYPGIKPAS